MRRSSVILFLSIATSTPCIANECLSQSELYHMSRMAVVGGTGLALNACAKCLGPEKHEDSKRNFEAANLLTDFRKSQSAIGGLTQAKTDYVNSLLRPYLALYGRDLSVNCEACSKTASAIEAMALASEARETTYRMGMTDLASSPEFRACP